jgi:DNA-binding NarL/FixJ family response regulator
MLGGVRALLDDLFEAVLMVADERSLVAAITMSNPELVVVDLSLPGSEEANIAGRLKSRFPDLRIVVLSVHDEPAVARQSLDAGAGAFVLKRTAATDLLPAVREVLLGGTYVSPAVEGQPGRGGLSPPGEHDDPEEEG